MRLLTKSMLFYVFLMNTSVYAAQTVVFALDIVRHGDRTPISEIPTDPHLWAQGLGELSARGMEQEFSLGMQLREKYVNRDKLLPPNYDVNSIYVRSSDYNRTLMSAQALLLGLYPLGSGPLLVSESPALPMGFQPIPIHTVSQKEDNLLVPKRNHTEFESMQQQYVISSNDWQQKSSQYQVKLQSWSRASGIPLNNLGNITGLADNLYIRKLYDVAMPNGISKQDCDEIITLANWVTAHLNAPYSLGAYSSKDLRSAIAQYFSGATTPNNQLKYVLFLAHDSTLLALMSAFKQPLSMIPPYASDLNLVLLRDEETKNYFVRLQFNGVTVSLTGCHGNCNLTQFMQFLK